MNIDSLKIEKTINQANQIFQNTLMLYPKTALISFVALAALNLVSFSFLSLVVFGIFSCFLCQNRDRFMIALESKRSIKQEWTATPEEQEQILREIGAKRVVYKGISWVQSFFK